MSDGNIYQDTLAPCNRYSNPISDDYRIYQRAAKRIETADLDRYIASDAAKEREIIEQMMMNFFGKNSGRMFFLGQFGKFILLNLVLPPIHIAFKVPKWLSENVLPKVLEVAKNSTTAMKDLMNRLAENLKSIDKQLGKYLKTAGNNATDAVSQLAAKMKLGEAYAALQGMLAHLASIQNSWTNQAGKTWEGIEKEIKEKINNTRRTVAEFVKMPLENLKKNTTHLMEKTGNAIHGVYNQITEPFRKLADQVKTGIEAVQQKAQETVQLPINWALEHYKQLANFANKHGKEIAEAIEKLDKKVKKKSEEITANVTNFIHKATEVVSVGMAQMMQVIPDPVINLFSNLSSGGSNTLDRTRNRWKSMVARTREMIQKVKRTFDGFKRWVYEQTLRIKKAVLWVFDQIILTISKFYQGLLALLMRLFNEFKKIWRGIRIFFSVIGLMLRYTFLMIRESFR